MKKWIVWVMSLVVVGCQKGNFLPPKENTVLVTIAPYAFFIHRVAGDTVTVLTFIPEEVNPHLYEPRPKEVEKIRQASLWVRLGSSFDQKIYQVFQEQHPSLQVIDVTQGIALLSPSEERTHTHSHCSSSEEGKDIHIWLSPKLAQIQARTIAEALIATFPKHASLYEKNLTLFIEELDQLDRDISTLLSSKKGSAILVSHPAFAYFCQDYNLVQLSVEVEGKEPLPQQVTELLEEAKHHAIGTVFLEPQYSNKGAELIAQELKVPTALVNPYAQDYLDNLRLIAQIIAQSPLLE